MLGNMDIFLREVTDSEKDLVRIQRDYEMEQIRSAANKLTWESLHDMNRQNLLRKKSTLDPDSRLEIRKAAQLLNRKKPIPSTGSIEKIICEIADSLECEVEKILDGFMLRNNRICIQILYDDEDFQQCQIGYWNNPMMVAMEALQLLRDGKFAEFRDSIRTMACRLPESLSDNDLSIANDAFRCIDALLIQTSFDNSFAAIRGTEFGYYVQGTDLTAGKLYFFCEQWYMRKKAKSGVTWATYEDLCHLPYLELGIESCEKDCLFPQYSQDGIWTNFLSAPACVRISFPTGMLITNETMKKMEELKMMAKSPDVKFFTNFYRYLARIEQTDNNRKLLTNFQVKDAPEHQYHIDLSSFHEENDYVVNAIYLNDLRHLSSFIQILRGEMMHASHWESIVVMCQRIDRDVRLTVNAILFKAKMSRSLMEFEVNTSHGEIKFTIYEGEDGLFYVRCNFISDGATLGDEFDGFLSFKLQESSSVPVTLKHAMTHLNNKLESVDVPQPSPSKTSYKTNKRSFIFKVPR